MKKMLILVLFILSIFVITGCYKPEIACNKPYIKVGAECCLDANDNGICDKDEPEPSPETISVEEIAPLGIEPGTCVILGPEGSITGTIDIPCEKTSDCYARAKPVVKDLSRVKCFGKEEQESVCGDGVCDIDENCGTCSKDCGICFKVDNFNMSPGEGVTKVGIDKPIITYTPERRVSPYVLTSIRNLADKPLENINYNYYCKTNFGDYDSNNARIEALITTDGENTGLHKVNGEENLQISSSFSLFVDTQAMTDSGRQHGNKIINLPAQDSVSFSMTFDNLIGLEYFDPREFEADCSVTFVSEDPAFSETKEFIVKYEK